MAKTLLKLWMGLVGGVAGTMAMQAIMKASGKLPEPIRPPMPARDPGQVMMEKAQTVVGTLPVKVHQVGAQGLHWGYGVVGPLAMAAVSSILGARSTGKTILAGTLVGVAVWAAGYVGWLPALGLVPPVHKVPIGKSASGLLGHAAYGALASLPLALATPRIDRVGGRRWN